jgi:hypothetical protein
VSGESEDPRCTAARAELGELVEVVNRATADGLVPEGQVVVALDVEGMRRSVDGPRSGVALGPVDWAIGLAHKLGGDAAVIETLKTQPTPGTRWVLLAKGQIGGRLIVAINTLHLSDGSFS